MKLLKPITISLALVLLAAPLFLSCQGQSESAPAGEAATAAGTEDAPFDIPLTADELASRLKKYARVELKYDESVLSAPEREALAKLVQAGAIMDDIFMEQVWSGNKAMQHKLQEMHNDSHGGDSWAAKNHGMLENLHKFFVINFGPWDRLDGDSPFMTNMPKPAAANYYPEDLTKEEFEAHIAANPGDEEAFRGYFTKIERRDGKLVAVPYSEAYKTELARAATLMHEAADILTTPDNIKQFSRELDYATFAKFLRSRADAFMSNEYQKSDMDWMDIRDNTIDITIGPYEVYEDGLNGYKAAFTTFLGIRHPEDSKKLEGLKQHLQTLENALPIPDEHKNPNRGSESPVSVIDLVYTGGDTKAGVQTIAYNLPNDETVREIKGSKKVMLKNITRAKFDNILIPIAEQVLDKEQIKYVEFDAYFNNVLMHELAHGVGPGKLTREDGSETTVGLELKELYAPIEEAKADVLGLFCRKVLIEEGFFPEEDAVKGYVSFLPGFFRAIRFGSSSAHGRANMIEFNFIREQGAIVLDEKTDRFHVVLAKMPAAVEALSNKLLMIQAEGSYDGAKAFLEKYGSGGPDIDRLLKKLAKIPTDIEPVYQGEKYVKTSS